MKKCSYKFLIFGLIIIGLILTIPSILYLMNYKTIDGYEGILYYFINNDGIIASIFGAIIFAVLLILSFLIYLKLIKHSNEFNMKKLFLSIALVGFVFLIALPNTSTDVFYYMGTGRVLEEYGQNPYYYTIEEILIENSEDIILRNSGTWKSETSIYGPVWVIICFIFNKICFNSATLLLYIFKISALILHIANCFLIYKITKKKKFVVLYGFNPLVLIEFMINCHNDIYLLFFVLMAIYFLKNRKNIWLTLMMLAISVGIKHLTLILVPIFVLYYLQDKKVEKKIWYIALYAIFFIVLLYIMYLPFINRISEVFSIIMGQQNKIKDSIYLVIYLVSRSNVVVTVVYSIMIFCFAYYYIIVFLKFIMRKNNFRQMMQSISYMLLLLIFGVLTNLTSWYLSWLFISIYWLKGKDIKTILWVQFLYELTYSYLYIWHTDSYILAVVIIPTILVGLIIRMIFLKCKKRNELTNTQLLKRN